MDFARLGDTARLSQQPAEQILHAFDRMDAIARVETTRCVLALACGFRDDDFFFHRPPAFSASQERILKPRFSALLGGLDDSRTARAADLMIDQLKRNLSVEERREIIRWGKFFAYALPFMSRGMDSGSAWSFLVSTAEARQGWITQLNEMVDAILGLESAKAEAALPGGAIGRFAGAVDANGIDLIMTPYAEFDALFQMIPPKSGQTFVDLGAGYGRLGFFLQIAYPGVRFVGYELNPARVSEANRVIECLGLSEMRMTQQDLGEAGFAPCEADCYFLFDPADAQTMRKMLNDLRNIGTKRQIRVIARAFREDFHRFIGKEDWLKPVLSLPGKSGSRGRVGMIRIFESL